MATGMRWWSVKPPVVRWSLEEAWGVFLVCVRSGGLIAVSSLRGSCGADSLSAGILPHPRRRAVAGTRKPISVHAAERSMPSLTHCPTQASVIGGHSSSPKGTVLKREQSARAGGRETGRGGISVRGQTRGLREGGRGICGSRRGRVVCRSPGSIPPQKKTHVSPNPLPQRPQLSATTLRF